MEMAPSPDKTLPQSIETVCSPTTERLEQHESEVSTLENDKMNIEVQESSPNNETANTVTPAAVSPILIGTMTYIGGTVYCKGKWGMSKEAHTIPGQTSDFEFKLVKADDTNSSYPVNGKYQGWFHIKQPPPLKGHTKVDDKEMNIVFTALDDGNHTVAGEGYNKFGKFRLRGVHHSDGTVEIYRDYYATVYQPPALKRGKSESKKEGKPIPPELSTTPREGGRIRKQSSVLKEYQDTTVKSQAPKSEPLLVAPIVSNVPTSNPPTLVRQTTDRAHRLNATMKKCLDVLKDISRAPQAIWFLEPVDPVALNIPDYPKIIKEPMDFSTIRSNIENSLYEGINDFAAHMRLVFKNAITFNQSRDNPVHIAAREMSERFERQFRQLVAQLAPDEYALLPQLESKVGYGKFGKKTSKGKEGQILKTPRGAVGARPNAGFGNLNPVAYDSSTQKILEMERMMSSMRDELEQLRASVRVSEAHKFVEETKAAAQNPLTLEEKKQLIAAIHNLPPQKMEEVLEIIQRSLPPGTSDSDGEIQVPLDSLDTLTLRKLQTFIAENGDKKKKRSISQSDLGKIKSEGSSKKPRKKAPATNALAHEAMPMDNYHSTDHDLDIFGHEDDALLFESEVLDEAQTSNAHNQKSIDVKPMRMDDGNEWGNVKESGHEKNSSSGSHTTVADEEEDNDDGWNMAAAELRSKQPHLEE